jgi:hypothetical protein
MKARHRDGSDLGYRDAIEGGVDGMAGAVVLARGVCDVSGLAEDLRRREHGDAGPDEQDRAEPLHRTR